MAQPAFSVEKFGIFQFDGKNYDHWKFRMETILDQYGVKTCIEKEILNATEEQTKQDKKCKSIIVQGVSNSHLEYIKDKKTSFEMWKALESVFQRKGIASQLYLRRKILTMKLGHGESLEAHFIKFEETVRELKSVGATLEEVDIVCHLLLTLPKNYDAIVTALETLESEKLTLDFVKGKLLDHEMKKKNTELDKNGLGAAAFSSGFNQKRSNYKKPNKEHRNGLESKYKNTSTSNDIRCHNCGKVGHLRKQCWFRKEANQAGSEEDKEKHIAFIAAVEEIPMGYAASSASDYKNVIRFLVDSGATNHMVNSDEYFCEVKDLEHEIKIAVAKNSESLSATKIGNVKVNLNENYTGEIKDILFVSNLRQNLLSVRKLEESGLKVSFENNRVLIYKNQKLLADGKRMNNLYTIEFNVINDYEVNMCKNNKNLELWHARLGHLSNGNLIKLSKMVEGFDINNVECKDHEICSICAQSKITRIPFTKVSRKVTKRPLELVHSDICGPITPKTHDNKSYFLTFLDDHTHFSIVYLLEYKTEFFECFKDFEAMVTNRIGYRIGSLQCDNGSEYCSNEFTSFCRVKGIRIRYTVPYNPEMNGAAERLNRTLLEKGRAILLQSRLPKSMWGESILCSTYLANRSPTVTLQDVTPAEMFYNVKPNLKNIKLFGSLVYNHIPKQKQKSKFDAKSEINIMIGYAENGYRLWNPLTEKVVIGRNVIFDEAKNISNIQEIKDNVEINDSESSVREIVVKDYDMNDSDREVKDISDVQNDNSEKDDEEETNLRKSTRIKRKPGYFNDYLNENEMEHMALNATSFVEEVPESLKKAETMSDYKMWKNAVEEEMNSLSKNNTWTLVQKPGNTRIIGCKWVFRIKRNNLGETVKYKARLVAKGFMQKEGFDFTETYAPVARLTTVRTLLAVVNFKNMKIQQMDVKSAFLHGKIEEEIYMTMPEGFEDDGRVCKLNKALYGLKQAPYCWNKKFDEFAERENLIKSKNDPCLYIKSTKNSVIYLLLYVDDILITSDDENEISKVKQKLKEEFEMQDLGNLKTFLGINIRETEAGIYLNQKNYIEDLLKRFNMYDCKEMKTPMNEGNINPEETDCENVEHKPIRELTGCLMYLMLATRPDLSISVNLCSRYQSNPSEQLWKNLKRILRYLKGSINLELFFPKNNNVKLIGFADADWAGDNNDRKSTTGYLFKIFGSTVCWTTRKQSTVATSSTEAEYVALAEATKEGIWLSNLLSDFGFAKEIFTIFEDNQSCIQLTKRWDHKRLKHVDVKFNFIKDLVSNKTILIDYISTGEQIADILTKNLGGNLFVKHRISLGLLDNI